MVMQKGTITSDDSLAISYNIMYGFLVYDPVFALFSIYHSELKTYVSQNPVCRCLLQFTEIHSN